MKIIRACLLIAILITSQSCNRQIARINPETATDLSGAWNDTDSKLTSQEIATEVLTQPWLSKFKEVSPTKDPVIIVGLITNQSHEHIDSETFTKDMEMSFVNSQKVRLVQGGKKREELRGERADQQENASKSTMKQWGLEVGADYIMQGSITSIVDSYKRTKTIYYQVSMELTSIQTNEVVWIGGKKIKKLVKN